MEQEKQEIDVEWKKLKEKIKGLFGKTPDINSILFLIGVQELGKGASSFSKEDKQNLIHIATCKVLSYSGYYKLVGLDQDGWPHWEVDKKLPFFDLKDQEYFLKAHILEYFDNEVKI